MPPASANYRYLRQTRVFLRLFAPVAAWFVLGCGGILFGLEAQKLLTTQFALGERLVLGLWALIYLAGPALAAALIYRLLRSGSDLIDLWIDQAEAAQRQVVIFQEELAPALRRLTAVLEALAKGTPVDPNPIPPDPGRRYQ